MFASCENPPPVRDVQVFVVWGLQRSASVARFLFLKFWDGLEMEKGKGICSVLEK
jgi:hypothetical protein